MQPILKATCCVPIVALVLLSTAIGIGDETDKPSASASPDAKAPDNELPSVKEARGRAKLLHETFHATLQVVHQKYFRPDTGLPIPSFVLENVFHELARRQKVELRWLAVNAQAMNVDHDPQDEFEKRAVKALASGAEDFEQVENGMYRRVGVITLTSDCLRCHLPNRTSTDDRAAGLIIAMPIEKK